MKYYQGTMIVSAMGKNRLKCDLCGKECLGLTIREDQVKVCNSCLEKDNEAEYMNESGNFKWCRN